MKGVILAAGKGTRLYPISKVIPKCILPVYDKPMIYYSIEVLKKFGISEIAIVVSKDNGDLFQKLLEDGSEFGIRITYIFQEIARGNAAAFKLSKEFVNDEDVTLIFGDNIFVGDMTNIVKEALINLEKGYNTLIANTVTNPEIYGVIETDKNGNVISIEEKPEKPKSNLISTGLFVYDNSVFDKIECITPSKRGEYEMTDVNKIYMQENRLKSIQIDSKSCMWYDAGNVDELLTVSNEVKKHKNN